MPSSNPADPGSLPQGTAQYVSDEIGDPQDRIRLQLGDDEWLVAESWSVEESVLSQPSRWSVRLGFDTLAKQAYWRYPPRTPFLYTILGNIQANGRTDSRKIEQTNDGIELVISGRDALAPLNDSYVTVQTSFKDKTYTDIVKHAMDEVGLDSGRLLSTNASNRDARVGVPVKEIAPPDVVDQLEQQVPGTIGAIQGDIQAKVGMRWLEFIRKQLDRAGLMLWAAANGDFILSAPNAQQKPTYTLYRDLGNTTVAGKSNIVHCSLEDNATDRHTAIVIYGRGGGRKHGQVKAKGLFADQEMIGWGYDQPKVLRDTYVQTGAQSAYFARRHLAEERRNGWRLEYTFAGHSLPAFGKPDNVRAVVIPDTVVWVHDELLGLDGFYYIESVRRQRSPETITSIRLMRPEDMVFGELTQVAKAAQDTPAAGGPAAQDESLYFNAGRPKGFGQPQPPRGQTQRVLAAGKQKQLG